MATSLDPMQMINAGAEPWTDSLSWAGAFIAVAIVAVVGLRLWHTARFRPVTILLLAAQIGFVAWAFGTIYMDF